MFKKKISLTFLILLLCGNALAQQARLPSLDEINADLLSKKASLEPFDPRKVKVDAKSLDVDSDKKDVAVGGVTQDKASSEAVGVKNNSAEPVQNSTSNSLPLVKLPEINQESNVKDNGLKVDAVSSGSIVNKFKTLIKKELPEEKKQAENKVNNMVKVEVVKVNNSKDFKQTKNELKQQEKLKKLQILRKEYISKALIDEDLERDNSSWLDSSESPVPQKKNLNKFIVEESPPQPILDNVRTSDNIHIPLIITNQQKIKYLFNAIAADSVSTFDSAFKEIENPNVKNENGDTLLTYSILLRRHSFVASVLSKGADPDMSNDLGYTPLNIAIELGDFELFKLLAKNNANLNYVDAFGRNYLMQASRVGMLAVVEYLVKNGFDINAMDNDGFTALAIAYRHKKEVIQKFLIKNGAKTWVEKPDASQKQSLINELKNRW